LKILALIANILKNTVRVHIEYSSRYFVDTGYSTLQNDSDVFFNNIKFIEF
jgi:hypothetical protein